MGDFDIHILILQDSIVIIDYEWYRTRDSIFAGRIEIKNIAVDSYRHYIEVNFSSNDLHGINMFLVTANSLKLFV
jgi:hypothetical protein